MRIILFLVLVVCLMMPGLGRTNTWKYVGDAGAYEISRHYADTDYWKAGGHGRALRLSIKSRDIVRIAQDRQVRGNIQWITWRYDPNGDMWITTDGNYGARRGESLYKFINFCIDRY